MKISFYIQPNAHKTEFAGLHGEVLKIKIKAPPVDGEANDELIQFLSKFFKIARSHLEITSGHKSRTKTVHFDITDDKEKLIRLELKALASV